MFLSQMTVNLEADGTVRAVRGEYVEVDANGRTAPVGTKRLAGADIEAALPATGALLAQIDALKSEVEAIKKERDDAVKATEAAESGKAAAEAAKLAAIAQAETEKAALQSQIDALQAQLNPVDAGGFPVLTAVQVRLALLSVGITKAMVDDVVKQLPEGVERETAYTYWEYAAHLRREHPFITHFAEALGLKSDQVDELWRKAAEIS